MGGDVSKSYLVMKSTLGAISLKLLGGKLASKRILYTEKGALKTLVKWYPGFCHFCDCLLNVKICSDDAATILLFVGIPQQSLADVSVIQSGDGWMANGIMKLHQSSARIQWDIYVLKLLGKKF